MNLTSRQQEVLQIILDSIETLGFPPTVREVRDELGIKSVRGAVVHLEALERKGYLRRTSQARGITVLKNGKSGRESAEIRIPLVGRIAAGAPLLAQQNIEKYISVRKEYLKGAHEAFLLRVQGDSMIEAGISPGDLAIVTPSSSAQNGEVVVALLQDEATLKKFHQVENYVALLPANPRYQPIIGREFSIQGRVVGVIKPGQRRRESLLSDSALVPVYQMQLDEEFPASSKWAFGVGRSEA